MKYRYQIVLPEYPKGATFTRDEAKARSLIDTGINVQSEGYALIAFTNNYDNEIAFLAVPDPTTVTP